MNLSRRKLETLCRWWCILNCWEWPYDLPMEVPIQCSKDCPAFVKAWEAVERAIVAKATIPYWRNVFHPEREKLRKKERQKWEKVFQ